jgi:hypothetical protein
MKDGLPDSVVTGIAQDNPQETVQMDRLMVRKSLKAFQGIFHIGVTVEGPLPAPLDVGAILQDHPTEVHRGIGRHHRAAIAFLVEPRQQPAVVEVGMGQKDPVDLLGIKGKRSVVVPILLPLEQAAVHQQPVPLGFQQEAGPRNHPPTAPQKLERNLQCSTLLTLFLSGPGSSRSLPSLSPLPITPAE